MSGCGSPKVIGKYKMAKRLRCSTSTEQVVPLPTQQSASPSAAVKRLLDGLYVVTSPACAASEARCPRRRYAPTNAWAQSSSAFRCLNDRSDLKHATHLSPCRPCRVRRTRVAAACLPTTSSGTCAPGSSHCCSTTRSRAGHRALRSWPRIASLGLGQGESSLPSAPPPAGPCSSLRTLLDDLATLVKNQVVRTRSCHNYLNRSRS